MNETLILLKTIHRTFDTISLQGIDNMSKLVGCANALDTAMTQIEGLVSENEKLRHQLQAVSAEEKEA